VVASEVMAIFCLSTSLNDLKGASATSSSATRVRSSPSTHAICTPRRDDRASAAGTRSQLVQTLENNPAFIHGGPFANIAHGCNP